MTTFGLDDLPEGLTELEKALMLTFMVYCSERTEVKISKGKRCRGQGPGETRCELPVVVSQWNCMDSTYFSQQLCVTTHMKYCQPWKPT